MHRTYARAPIIESTIELRFQAHPLSVDQIGEVANTLPGQWLAAAELRSRELEVPLGPGDVKTVGDVREGLKVTSVDNAWAVHIKADLFAVSVLAPYPGWVNFLERVRSLWWHVESTAGRRNFETPGLRTINLIELDLPVLDFKSYIRSFPELPPDMPQSVSGMVMRLTIPLDDPPVSVGFAQTIVRGSSAKSIGFVIDLDLRLKQAVVDDQDLFWSNTIEKMHLARNELFEACITDKTREIFSHGVV